MQWKPSKEVRSRKEEANGEKGTQDFDYPAQDSQRTTLHLDAGEGHLVSANHGFDLGPKDFITMAIAFFGWCLLAIAGACISEWWIEDE